MKLACRRLDKGNYDLFVVLLTQKHMSVRKTVNNNSVARQLHMKTLLMKTQKDF